jgi:hypothetical protein
MFKPIKRSKYGNKKVVSGNDTFDSKKEFKRYNELVFMQQKGMISNLQKQVKFELIPAMYEEVEVALKTKTKIVKKSIQMSINYVADFVYDDTNGNRVVEDVKASKIFQDGVYKIKKKLMRYIHGIEIKEIL